jgi:hypothetical protein
VPERHHGIGVLIEVATAPLAAKEQDATTVGALEAAPLTRHRV